MNKQQKRNNVVISFTSDEIFNQIKAENKISMSYTIQEMIKNYLRIREVSLAELQGIFSEEEWKFFAESLNGTMIEGTFRYSKGAFIAHCEDSLKYEGTQFAVSLEDIKKKIDGLKGANIDALYNRVEHFWENCISINLDEWAKF